MMRSPVDEADEGPATCVALKRLDGKQGRTIDTRREAIGQSERGEFERLQRAPFNFSRRRRVFRFSLAWVGVGARVWVGKVLGAT